MKKFRVNLLIALILLGASTLTAFSGRVDTPPELFSPTAQAISLGNPVSPTIARTRFATADLALLEAATPGDLIRLNLYPDVQFTLVLERKEAARPEGFAWVGRLQEVERGQAVLVVSGGQMAANITAGLAQYQVRYGGDGVYAIHTIDQSQFPDELPPKIPAARSGPEPAAPVVADVCSAMDVMVVWTPAARAAEGGVTQMQNLVNLAVIETNQSYINSNMDQRINLTHMEEVAYTESGDMATDLERLTSPSDGYIDNVHTLRNTYYADLVSMFSVSDQYCGIGWMMSTVSSSFEGSAFTVVASNCATGYYSFAHEMGHNEGARHEWYSDTNTTPFTYSHGFVYLPGQWRTVMAYDAQCQAGGVSCTRLQYWSNPGVLYNGVAMGVSGGTNPADNHLALNNTCSTVANFRDEPEPPGAFNKTAPANAATGVSVNPTISWSSSSNATSYEYCYDTTNDQACSNWTSNGSATSKGLVNLSGSTTYYWHVRAKNSAGTIYSNGDTWWSFTTQVVTKSYAFLASVARNNRICAPLFSDNFGSASSGWPVADNGNSLTEYNNGEYRILVRSTQYGWGVRKDYQATSYTAEVELRNPNAVWGSYGLGFGIASDFSTLYSFEIYPDGYYGIYRYDPTEIVILAEAFSPAINTGDLRNRIKVERNGSSIKVFANGTLLNNVTDSTYSGSRYIGLLAFSYDQPDVDVRFDNIAVTPLTCAVAGSPFVQAPAPPGGGIFDRLVIQGSFAKHQR